MAAVLAVGLAAGLLVALLVPRLAGPAGLLAAAWVAWRLWLCPSSDSLAWRRGAAGERRTARLLAPLERQGGGRSCTTIDHLVIGPGRVVVIDTKQYRERLHRDRYGFLWHGRHLLISNLRRVRWQADQADEVLGIADIQVAAIVAVHGSSVPWGCLEADGVTVVPARRVPDLCGRCRRCLGLSGCPGWPTEPGCGSAPPPDGPH